MGSADPTEKMDEKLKSENKQKEHFLCYVIFESSHGRQM